MVIKIIENTNNLEYIVMNAPEEYREVLLHYQFTERNNNFTKLYHKSTFMFDHDKKILENNFKSSLQRDINYSISKTKFDWDKSLEELVAKMNSNNIKWWLTGSAACAIRGIDIIPRDIDVMTYKTEINKIKSAFKNIIIEPFHYVSDWVVKGFGVIDLGGRVDIAFEPVKSSDDNKLDFGRYAMHNLEIIKWRGYPIYVPPVELHIYSNEIRGRNDRVEKIQRYIKSQ